MIHNFVLLQYFSLPAVVAPYKCSVLPLSNKPELNAIVKQICKYYATLCVIDVNYWTVSETWGDFNECIYILTKALLEWSYGFSVTADTFATITKRCKYRSTSDNEDKVTSSCTRTQTFTQPWLVLTAYNPNLRNRLFFFTVFYSLSSCPCAVCDVLHFTQLNVIGCCRNRHWGKLTTCHDHSVWAWFNFGVYAYSDKPDVAHNFQWVRS